MTSLTFNQETAIALQSSGDAQPVDFDLAWVWLGYSTKASALRKLKNNFDKDVDYSTKWLSVAHSKGSTASRTQVIHLTIECFKSMGMMFQSITEPIIFPLTQEQRDRMPEHQKALSIFTTKVSVEPYDSTQTSTRIEMRVEGVPSVALLNRLMELKHGELILFSDVKESGCPISSGFSANSSFGIVFEAYPERQDMLPKLSIVERHSSFGIVFEAYPGDWDMLPKLSIIERPQDLTRVKMKIWVCDPEKGSKLS